MEEKVSLFKTDEVMTVSEVAKRLRVSKDVVYQMCKSNELPSVKLGKQIRILGWQMKKWLEKGC